MKKIAFMFAAAAMMVACGDNAPKTATAEQLDSIYNALKAECVAQAEAIVPEYNIFVEGSEEVIDSVACQAVADSLKAAAIAAADTTNADFKAAYDAAVADFEAALNLPAEVAEAIDEAVEGVTEE